METEDKCLTAKTNQELSKLIAKLTFCHFQQNNQGMDLQFFD